jgi:hypothetical protein
VSATAGGGAAITGRASAGVAAHAFRPFGAPMSSAIGVTLGTAAHRCGWPVAEDEVRRRWDEVTPEARWQTSRVQIQERRRRRDAECVRAVVRGWLSRPGEPRGGGTS